MDFRKEFKIAAGAKVDLKKIETDSKGGFKDKDEGNEQLEKNLKRIEELQELLYAEHKHSVLIVLQAMDAAGKDGTVKVIAGAMNPQGVKVTSFKAPTKEELDHDFLWRVHKAIPAKGEVGVFNRSHYEDVLVVRVNDLAPKEVWKERYDLINNFEKQLTEGGTTVLKFFLHISQEEQMKRFEDRFNDASKNWKISDSDYSERPKWDKYREAYEDVLSKCSKDSAPWFVIPADHKWFRNVAISQIIVDYLEDLHMKYPKPSADLDAISKAYFNGKPPGVKP